MIPSPLEILLFVTFGALVGLLCALFLCRAYFDAKLDYMKRVFKLSQKGASDGREAREDAGASAGR